MKSCVYPPIKPIPLDKEHFSHKVFGRHHTLGPKEHQVIVQHRHRFLDESKDISHMSSPVVLEIGLGYGEHLIHYAQNNPNHTLIGVEPYAKGLVKMLRPLNAETHPLLHVWQDNITTLWPKIPSGTLQTIFLLFSDPWPKKRHHRRRVFTASFLKECYRCLQPDGVLIVASDHAEYQTWIQEHIQKEPRNLWHTQTSCWPSQWPLTRYGQKAITEGRTPRVWTLRRLLGE